MPLSGSPQTTTTEPHFIKSTNFPSTDRQIAMSPSVEQKVEIGHLEDVAFSQGYVPGTKEESRLVRKVSFYLHLRRSPHRAGGDRPSRDPVG